MDKNDFHIRDAQEKEWSIIRDVTLAAYVEYQTLLSPHFWTQYRRNIIETLDGERLYECIVAEQQGSIVGSVLLYPPAGGANTDVALSLPCPEVRLLAVLPEVRGQSIGNALMSECERRARNAGATALGLHTTEMMQAAVHLYERMGFVRTPETDFRPGEGMLVLGYRRTL